MCGIGLKSLAIIVAKKIAPADLRNATTVAELDQWLGNRKCILWVVMPVLFALEKVENQLVQYKVEARKAKQASIKTFFTPSKKHSAKRSEVVPPEIVLDAKLGS